MRLAIYARYSSALQSPTSIEDQIALCRQRAKHLGYSVDDRNIVQDREVSGAVAERPGFRKLKEFVRGRGIDAVIVEHQDRLSRDQEALQAFLKLCWHHRVKVLSVATGDLDLADPRSGRQLATIGGIQAETFLVSLKEKTHRGMAGQIGRGYTAGGSAYGYRSEPEYHAAEKDEYGRPKIIGVRRMIDESEANIVRRIFREYAAGSSPKAIVYRLNAEMVPPPRPKRGRKAQGWTWTTVRGMLRNRLYLGEVYWNRSMKERDPEDPNRRVTRPRPRDEWLRRDRPDLRIVDDALWAKVQARIRAMGQPNGKDGKGRHGGPRPQYLFSGLLRCGVCGAHYIVKDKRGYACSFYVNRGPHVCENRRTVKRKDLEHILLGVIQEEILAPRNVDYLTRQVEKALARASTRDASARKTLEARLREVEREAANIKDAVRHGKATRELLEMLEETSERAQRLRADLSATPRARAAVRMLPGIVERYARDLRAVLERDEDRGRGRHLLQWLLGEIILRPGKDGLMADLRGNLSVLLEGEGGLSAATGAGRGI